MERAVGCDGQIRRVVSNGKAISAQRGPAPLARTVEPACPSRLSPRTIGHMAERQIETSPHDYGHIPRCCNSHSPDSRDPRAHLVVLPSRSASRSRTWELGAMGYIHDPRLNLGCGIWRTMRGRVQSFTPRRTLPGDPSTVRPAQPGNEVRSARLHFVFTAICGRQGTPTRVLAVRWTVIPRAVPKYP